MVRVRADAHPHDKRYAASSVPRALIGMFLGIETAIGRFDAHLGHRHTEACLTLRRSNLRRFGTSIRFSGKHWFCHPYVRRRCRRRPSLFPHRNPGAMRSVNRRQPQLLNCPRSTRHSRPLAAQLRPSIVIEDVRRLGLSTRMSAAGRNTSNLLPGQAACYNAQTRVLLDRLDADERQVHRQNCAPCLGRTARLG